MKLTNNSHKLISFFVKNNNIPVIKQTKQTDTIFTTLYHEIHNGFKYVESIKPIVHYEQIKNISQIPKPTTFHFSDFPLNIQQRIDSHSVSALTYSLHLLTKDVTIFFILEVAITESVIKLYNTYVDIMLVWLYISSQYASKKCTTNMNIYIYHTGLTKTLPKNLKDTLDETHINTAFTRTCPINSEIVIFRKEEWFKVFIHETMHNLGLDFSDMKNATCHSKILSLFPVNSDVNLFEAYAEFWARTMNVLFCSYNNMKHADDITEFLINTEFFMNYERIYSFFQMVKVLDFMNVSYTTLYSPTVQSHIIRKNNYKENTNVLSYYVITLLLINNYQEFILWCNVNNSSLLQFKKTIANQHSFCKFIEKKYKSKQLLDGIEHTELLLTVMTNKNTNAGSNKGNPDIHFLLHNLRMTLCELG
jgi:hypothetical protein